MALLLSRERESRNQRCRANWLSVYAGATTALTARRNETSPAAIMSVHSTAIHPLPVIDPRPKVPGSCKVGPYCVIGPEVELGEDCRLLSHVAIEGPTKIGADNALFPFCAIGMAPQ